MPTTLASPVLRTHSQPHPIHALTQTASAARPVPPLSELLAREPARSLPLIVHSHLRWGPGSERPRQIFSRLSAHHPVLFVEPPMYGALDGPALQWSEPHPNVCRAIPLLPITLRGGEDVQRATIAAVLDAWIRGQARSASHTAHSLAAADRKMMERFQGAVQWFCSPMDAPFLIGRFGTIGSVYDRAGALAHPQRSAPDFPDRDRSLVRQAHLVFFTNELAGAARIPRTRADCTGHRQAYRPGNGLSHAHAQGHTEGHTNGQAHGHGNGHSGTLVQAPPVRTDASQANGHASASSRSAEPLSPVQARARRAVWDGVVSMMRQRLRVTFEAGSPRRLPPEFIAASATALGLH